MCFGSKWMLMWRSGPCCSSPIAPPSIATMRIVVVAVGRVRPPFTDDVAHYAQLLSGHARLRLVAGREDERVDRRMSGRDLCFVVGGPFGLELERADHRLSLGPLTLPHQLARVVLLEQLFRAHKILKNEPYHH